MSRGIAAMSIVRIGTRGSPLARWQANETARLLRGAGFASEIVEIRTTGDRRVDALVSGEVMARTVTLRDSMELVA
jgi:porphobilinogen deaminase